MANNNLPIDILSQVEKPARYTGGEFGEIVKTPEETEVSVALAFPDIYEVGMSYIGFRILYHILNNEKGVAAERAYTPWVDMEAKMRERDLPLTSLESKKALCDFDFVGFTLQYEMAYSNILNMLDMGRVAMFTKDRSIDDPFVIAGGPCVFNPEPLADFVDFFIVGEGEEIIVEVVNEFKAWQKEGKPGGRVEFLHRVVKLNGIYVPSFYAVDYKENGEIEAVRPIDDLAPATIFKRVIKNLDAAPYPVSPIVPFNQIVYDRIMLEIFRGCTRGCRFCNAGMVYRPVREKRKSTLVKQVRELVKSTGYDEISLLSLSTADYSCLVPFVRELIAEHADNKVSVSLPSLRVDSFSVELAKEVQTVRKSGLTFAPEAGSQRMRNIINKGVSEEDLMNAVSAAFEAGWSKIKLYFMIGLPGETDEDVIAIPELCKKVQAKYKEVTGHGGCQINMSASTFVPKAHTPFQWHGQVTLEEVQHKQGLIKEALKNTRNIRFEYHDGRTSMMEGVFSRGDRRLGKVLVKAWENGARFDGWSEGFNFDRWVDAIKESGLEEDFYNHRERGEKEVFPWEHVQPAVTRSFLWLEYKKSKLAELTPDCRFSTCHNCGVCQQLDVKIVDYRAENK